MLMKARKNVLLAREPKDARENPVRSNLAFGCFDGLIIVLPSVCEYVREHRYAHAWGGARWSTHDVNDDRFAAHAQFVLISGANNRVFTLSATNDDPPYSSRCIDPSSAKSSCSTINIIPVKPTPLVQRYKKVCLSQKMERCGTLGSHQCASQPRFAVCVFHWANRNTTLAGNASFRKVQVSKLVHPVIWVLW